MIFTARQIQEKSSEQHQGLYQVFVDITKAFDSVNRDALWNILKRFGCPDHFVSILQAYHNGMEVAVNAGGLITEYFEVKCGVKQGDLIAPTLFSIFFSAVLMHAFKDCTFGVYIKYRTTGKLFNLRRFTAKTKTFQCIVRDLLYADDCDLVSDSLQDMQTLMSRLSASCKEFGLSISLDKTVVMFQPAPGVPYTAPSIYVDGVKLKVVEKFTYLGSVLNRHCSLDDEISLRIKSASDAFYALQDRVWTRRNIKNDTKVAVYKTCVLTRLLYSCEAWVTYRKHITLLERFHQRCLRSILKIHWSSFVPDAQVLHKANCTSIEHTIHSTRLRWCGHVVRMNDERIPKKVLYGELLHGHRSQHKPKKRYKDCVKESLVACDIRIDGWEATALDRYIWRQEVKRGCSTFETNESKWAKVKRDIRKGKIPGKEVQQFVCTQCSRVCLSLAGLRSHERSHGDRPDICYREFVDFHASQQVDARSGSRPDKHVCRHCKIVFKSLAGFKSHCRSHKRMERQGVPAMDILD